MVPRLGQGRGNCLASLDYSCILNGVPCAALDRCLESEKVIMNIQDFQDQAARTKSKS